MFLFKRSSTMPDPAAALPGRDTPLAVGERHYVNASKITPPYPDGSAVAMFGARPGPPAR